MDMVDCGWNSDISSRKKWRSNTESTRNSCCRSTVTKLWLHLHWIFIMHFILWAAMVHNFTQQKTGARPNLLLVMIDLNHIWQLGEPKPLCAYIQTGFTSFGLMMFLMDGEEERLGQELVLGLEIAVLINRPGWRIGHVDDTWRIERASGFNFRSFWGWFLGGRWWGWRTGYGGRTVGVLDIAVLGLLLLLLLLLFWVL